jgi:hypothetical protein
MELREPIEEINRKLALEFGRDVLSNMPRFRVVFSEDQFEKRLTDYSDSGLFLTTPQVRLLPKYKQWITAKYILERYVEVQGETDLVERHSYEPAWVFQDKLGRYLPPFYEGCKLIIESMYSRIAGANSFAKYKDENATKEGRLAEIEKVERELFGNETEVGDHLAYGTGVSFAQDSGRHPLDRKIH